METFLSSEEIDALGLGSHGEEVFISRLAIIHHPERLYMGDHVRIDDFCYLTGDITMGDHVHVGCGVVLSAGSTGIILDDFVGVSPKSMLIAESEDYSGRYLTNSTIPLEYRHLSCGPIHLREHVIIGAGTTILPGVTVGKGSSVGAMSLLKDDVDSWSIYAGIPATKIKERSQEIIGYANKLLDEEQGQ